MEKANPLGATAARFSELLGEEAMKASGFGMTRAQRRAALEAAAREAAAARLISPRGTAYPPPPAFWDDDMVAFSHRGWAPPGGGSGVAAACAMKAAGRRYVVVLRRAGEGEMKGMVWLTPPEGRDARAYVMHLASLRSGRVTSQWMRLKDMRASINPMVQAVVAAEDAAAAAEVAEEAAATAARAEVTAREAREATAAAAEAVFYVAEAATGIAQMAAAGGIEALAAAVPGSEGDARVKAGPPVLFSAIVGRTPVAPPIPGSAPPRSRRSSALLEDASSLSAGAAAAALRYGGPVAAPGNDHPGGLGCHANSIVPSDALAPHVVMFGLFAPGGVRTAARLPTEPLLFVGDGAPVPAGVWTRDNPATTLPTPIALAVDGAHASAPAAFTLQLLAAAMPAAAAVAAPDAEVPTLTPWLRYKLPKPPAPAPPRGTQATRGALAHYVSALLGGALQPVFLLRRHSFATGRTEAVGGHRWLTLAQLAEPSLHVHPTLLYAARARFLAFMGYGAAPIPGARLSMGGFGSSPLAGAVARLVPGHFLGGLSSLDRARGFVANCRSFAETSVAALQLRKLETIARRARNEKRAREAKVRAAIAETKAALHDAAPSRVELGASVSRHSTGSGARGGGSGGGGGAGAGGAGGGSSAVGSSSSMLALGRDDPATGPDPTALNFVEDLPPEMRRIMPATRAPQHLIEMRPLEVKTTLELIDVGRNSSDEVEWFRAAPEFDEGVIAKRVLLRADGSVLHCLLMGGFPDEAGKDVAMRAMERSTGGVGRALQDVGVSARFMYRLRVFASNTGLVTNRWLRNEDLLRPLHDPHAFDDGLDPSAPLPGNPFQDAAALMACVGVPLAAQETPIATRIASGADVQRWVALRDAGSISAAAALPGGPHPSVALGGAYLLSLWARPPRSRSGAGEEERLATLLPGSVAAWEWDEGDEGHPVEAALRATLTSTVAFAGAGLDSGLLLRHARPRAGLPRFTLRVQYLRQPLSPWDTPAEHDARVGTEPGVRKGARMVEAEMRHFTLTGNFPSSARLPTLQSSEHVFALAFPKIRQQLVGTVAPWVEPAWAYAMFLEDLRKAALNPFVEELEDQGKQKKGGSAAASPPAGGGVAAARSPKGSKGLLAVAKPVAPA
jgi:hypothetical protein